MLFAYEGHMPVSCQHACPLFSLRFCQTRPHCCHQSAEHTTQPSIHTSSATPLLPRIQDHSPATRSVRDQTGTQYIDLFYYHPSSPLVLSASHSLNMSYISPHFHGLVFIFSYCWCFSEDINQLEFETSVFNSSSHSEAEVRPFLLDEDKVMNLTHWTICISFLSSLNCTVKNIHRNISPIHYSVYLPLFSFSRSFFKRPCPSTCGQVKYSHHLSWCAEGLQKAPRCQWSQWPMKCKKWTRRVQFSSHVF